MGVTIYANGVQQSFDCGYLGFGLIRLNIAKILDEELGVLYSYVISEKMDLMECKKKLISLLQKDRFSAYEDIIDFLFDSDCSGKISYKTCGKIYKLIKDFDFGDMIFTYAGRSDEKDYERFKVFLKECYAKRAYMRWS